MIGQSPIQGEKRFHLIAASLCVVLFMLVGCDSSMETVERTTDQTQLAKIVVEAKTEDVRIAAVKKLTDQTLLTKIAMEGKYANIRHAAVENLTDQILLAKIAIEDKDANIRQAAVKKLTDRALLEKMGMWVKPELTQQVNDQDLLARIAVEAADGDIRRAAVEKLANQALLAKIAMKDKAEDVRRAAVEKLNDQDLLAKFALGSVEADVRLAAAGMLTDQTLLAKVAVEAEDWDVDTRRAAVEKITDQTLLAKFVAESQPVDIRIAAIGQITDQAFLRQLAEKSSQSTIRLASLTRIIDEKQLIQMLTKESSAGTGQTIIGRLHEKDSLRKVAISAYRQKYREQAYQQLKQVSMDSTSEVALAHEALALREKALASETDSSKLLALVLDGEFDVLSKAAARRLSDPASLEKAALHCQDREVLIILLGKLEDKATLNRIAVRADDRAMCLAAAQKAGAKSWQEIFGNAITHEMRSDAIAAVSLFPTVQSDAIYSVQMAFLDMIRRGDASRIPEMVDLLEGYGNKTLAEDYANSGQHDLEVSARAWATRRGYSVDTGNGSHRATWGSGN